ncbi:hypothetical protein B566_EDAN014794 [Ephemera danica]|nr:hypothetical protein B566_EDAN014794 [Ephemera danica]
MAESNLTFERREGTDCDHGIKFEWQTTNLAYLRCEKLHRQWVQGNTSGVKSYFVANNVDGIGAFDDVVIRAEYSHQNEDKTKLIFVQCKHSANRKKCVLENLLKCGTVQKYFDSFIEVLRILNDHRALSCQTYNEINIRKKTKRQRTEKIERNTQNGQKLRNLFQCKPQDCEFVLYSNMILNAGFENTQTQEDNDISMKILDTAEKSNKFSGYDKDTNEYYEKLMNKNATPNEKLELENVISLPIKSMENETELMAIPLQITMLAEIYFEKFSEMTTEEKMSFSKKMDICSLYNAFIEKLVERYLVEKKKLILQNEEKIIAIRDKMRDAAELACKLICPDINQTPIAEYSDAILKMCNQVGLITNIDPPVFLHRTYGVKRHYMLQQKKITQRY